MRYNLLFLFLILISCSKQKIEPKKDYTCYIVDSSIYKYRTCANSRRFDSINYFDMNKLYGKETIANKTKSQIKTIESTTSLDTQIVSVGWLYCNIVTRNHDDFDTVFNFKKLNCF